MLSRILILSLIVALLSMACTPAQPLNPDQAPQSILNVWQANQHTVWELDWPNAPLVGTLTIETWRADNRYRFEILETPAPALVGEILVFDGQQAWRYNRFNPPSIFIPTAPALSPVSDAFTIVDQLLNTKPEKAVEEIVQINSKPAQKILLTFTTGDILTLWQNTEIELPVQVACSINGQQATMKARSVEPLVNPPLELFGAGRWVYSEFDTKSRSCF